MPAASLGFTIMREVNIKYDNPRVSDAIKRVTHYIHNSKHQGVSVLKIIHGYGSSGKGGAIRVKVREYLERQTAQRVIRGWIPGDEFSIFNPAVLKAFDVCGELHLDPDLERHNNGVTFIILR
ncbi:MAG: Smr/MutS family protein [Oscillospiraceae bacterium]|jgi:hypothetical protein|nr:Smr/MutS family protein [Oscillospiraceae bacterium]